MHALKPRDGMSNSKYHWYHPELLIVEWEAIKRKQKKRRVIDAKACATAEGTYNITNSTRYGAQWCWARRLTSKIQLGH